MLPYSYELHVTLLYKNFYYFARMFTIDWKGWKTLAIAWFITITVLFFLPGSALPKPGCLADIHFDKCVHFGFFALLVFLWRFFFHARIIYTWLILLLALVYGLGVEMIQHHLIANRSFDIFDVLADLGGSIAGVWFWTTRYIKNRPL